MQIAERSQAVVDGHHDYVTPACQRTAVEYRIVARSGGVPATMNRKQDGPLAAVLQARGPHVQHQAVFASSAGLCRPLDRARVVIVAAGQGLRRDVAPFESVARALPRRRLARRHEAVLTGSIRPVRHTAKHVNAVFGAAAESAIGRLRNGRRRRRARGSHHERGGPCSADPCREQRILFQECAASWHTFLLPIAFSSAPRRNSPFGTLLLPPQIRQKAGVEQMTPCGPVVATESPDVIFVVDLMIEQRLM